MFLTLRQCLSSSNKIISKCSFLCLFYVHSYGQRYHTYLHLYIYNTPLSRNRKKEFLQTPNVLITERPWNFASWGVCSEAIPKLFLRCKDVEREHWWNQLCSWRSSTFPSWVWFFWRLLAGLAFKVIHGLLSNETNQMSSCTPWNALCVLL